MYSFPVRSSTSFANFTPLSNEDNSKHSMLYFSTGKNGQPSIKLVKKEEIFLDNSFFRVINKNGKFPSTSIFDESSSNSDETVFNPYLRSDNITKDNLNSKLVNVKISRVNINCMKRKVDESINLSYSHSMSSDDDSDSASPPRKKHFCTCTIMPLYSPNNSDVSGSDINTNNHHYCINSEHRQRSGEKICDFTV